MKIGDEVYIHGYVDEIRKDTIIIRNKGGYFGTVQEEVVPSSQPPWIPCSERFPDYDETSEYLVTDKAGRVRHCCLDPYMPETFVTVEESMIVDAVAWRPAPEPYCKTESHEREGK